MEDVQSRIDERKIPINKVGIKDIKHPVAVNDRGGKVQHTIANFNMYVSLPENFKGTHMSRFVEILNQHEYEITVKSFQEMLGEVAEKLEAKTAHIEMQFPFFISKTAPASKVESLMDYDVSLIGVLDHGKLDISTRIIVPATSLCPCSKKISDYGAHNQRSHITVEIKTRDFIWIEELIEMVESQASAEVFSLLKRPDEKVVTEMAYDNPKFVEDLVRDVAGKLNNDKRISHYAVEAENFESIHNHSAYAKIIKP